MKHSESRTPSDHLFRMGLERGLHIANITLRHRYRLGSNDKLKTKYIPDVNLKARENLSQNISVFRQARGQSTCLSRDLHCRMGNGCRLKYPILDSLCTIFYFLYP